MKSFLVLLIISFLLVMAMILLLSFAKRRQGRTSHGLTGMCHESGGEMCGCCSAAYSTDKKTCNPTGK